MIENSDIIFNKKNKRNSDLWEVGIISRTLHISEVLPLDGAQLCFCHIDQWSFLRQFLLHVGFPSVRSLTDFVLAFPQILFSFFFELTLNQIRIVRFSGDSGVIGVMRE